LNKLDEKDKTRPSHDLFSSCHTLSEFGVEGETLLQILLKLVGYIQSMAKRKICKRCKTEY